MDSNKLFLLLIGIISIISVLKKLNRLTLVIYIATLVIGYSITKDAVSSFSWASIAIFIAIFMNTSDHNRIETFKSKSKKKKSKKRRKKTENFGLENDVEHKLDTKKSFLENYKTLTPEQIKGLNHDTQELINTQKSLIETLNNMGPALKDGKNILDTFKNYFGDDTDLGGLLKK